MNDNEKNALIAQCLEYFRRPVGPDHTIKNTKEYIQYLNCVYENIKAIHISIYISDKTEYINIANRIILAILIIILCCLIGGCILLALSLSSYWWLILLAPLFEGIIYFGMMAVSFCHNNILSITKKTFNIYEYIRRHLLWDSKQYNRKLSEVCAVLACRRCVNSYYEDLYCPKHDYESQLSLLSYLSRYETIFMIFSDAMRLKKYKYDDSTTTFLELPHDDIIKKYEEEIYSKEKAPIPESFFSN